MSAAGNGSAARALAWSQVLLWGAITVILGGPVYLVLAVVLLACLPYGVALLVLLAVPVAGFSLLVHLAKR